MTAQADAWSRCIPLYLPTRRYRSAGGEAIPMAIEPPGLSGRDRLIVQLIARFKQASPSQLHEVLFHDLTYKPLYRALNRLSTARAPHRPYLTRIERRTVGGSHGGSG